MQEVSTHSMISTHAGHDDSSSGRNSQQDQLSNPFWITVAFTLNYIIGSGFLTLPWAFQQAGILLGVFVLLVFGFYSMISAYFILEAMNRAEKLQHFQTVEIELKTMGAYRSVENPIHEDDIDRQLDEENPPTILDRERNNSSNSNEEDHLSADPTITSSNPSVTGGNETTERKREITELCHIFLGVKGKQAYALIICVFLYGILWAYTTVFANAFAAVAESTIGPSTYVIFVLVFSCIVVPISMMEFSEQVYIQVSLSIFRVVMVAAMILSIIVAYGRDDNEFQLTGDYQSEQVISEAFRMDWSKLYLMTPIAAYAFIFHHSVPALSEPITDKSTLNSLFRTTLIISVSFYIALGAVISGYFGQHTLASSNLNWKNYLAQNPSAAASAFGGVIRVFVLLFPAVDVASAFPLNAFTLGNNIMTAYYGKDIHQHVGTRWKTSLFRLLAAIPPIFGAFFVQDLGTITSWTGLTGFAIVFIFPPLLSYYSKQKLESLSIPSNTRHTSVWTSIYFQGLLVGSGVILTVYVGIILITTRQA